jgi:hypothetical protein
MALGRYLVLLPANVVNRREKVRARQGDEILGIWCRTI